MGGLGGMYLIGPLMEPCCQATQLLVRPPNGTLLPTKSSGSKKEGSWYRHYMCPVCRKWWYMTGRREAIPDEPRRYKGRSRWVAEELEPSEAPGLKRARELLGQDEPDAHEVKVADWVLRKELGDVDPFWIMWRVLMVKLGLKPQLDPPGPRPEAP